MEPKKIAAALDRADKGISSYLESARKEGRIDQQQYDVARKQTFPNLKKWMESPEIDTISPRLKDGLAATIDAGKWEDLVNAFRQSVRFGTGGIRGMMAFDRESIKRLQEEGLDAPVLKGPNTINNVVLLLMSAGVAKFGKAQNPPLEKLVIGYDSRVRGHDFAAIVAQLFLAYGYTVYFFDEPCPYPEVTFAIPDDLVKADMGILISASHNDYRYNGYKLSCGNGSQFDPQERDSMYKDYIAHATFADIRLMSFADAAAKGKLYFLGGKERVAGYDYAGCKECLINMHDRHLAHVSRFLMIPNIEQMQKAAADPLRIGFCAFHGAGRVAVPRLLQNVGFRHIDAIHEGGLNDLNGLFPSFNSDPGREQQPDPGDPRAGEVAVSAYKREYGEKFDKMDILIGTDPDADRCGVVVKVPPEQRHLHGGKDYYLLPADDAWSLVMWYRLQQEVEKYGKVQDADKKFIVLSHTTSDAIARVARKFGLGVVKTWVGFAALAAATRDVWDGRIEELLQLCEGRGGKYKDVCHPFVFGCDNIDAKRSINMAAMEQSNGFSILGGPPPDKRSLGAGGHVRDKDGTFAAVLMAEIAAWAKEKGMTLVELLDREIYLDPQVGMFVNLYEPDPLDGEYPGIEGDRKKIDILGRALDAYRKAQGGNLSIAGTPVKAVSIYRTGKYDAIYPPSENFEFPDEGIRFFFDEERLDHLTVRPSGTGNSLRFHVQLHAPVTQANLVASKEQLRNKGKAMLDAIREMIGAPRT
jgi:phosphoglucomutase